MRYIAAASLSFALAIAGGAASPTVATAQAKTQQVVAPAPSVGVTAMSGGWKREIRITVLGGFAATGSQLYYFPSPFDPLTGVFAPHRKVAVGPAAVGSGKSLWKASDNSTSLGQFSTGQQLVFGLWLPNNTWLFSAAVDARSVGLQQLSATQPKTLVAHLPATAVAGTDDAYFGFGVNAGVNGVDYNDFVFRTSQAIVTPEPATMTLLGLGLAALGGGVRSRRRRTA